MLPSATTAPYRRQHLVQLLRASLRQKVVMLQRKASGRIAVACSSFDCIGYFRWFSMRR